MNRHTIFLGRLIGLYTLVIAVWFLLNRQTGVSTIRAMLVDAPLMVFVAITALGVGLAMVLGHNVWSGGALPILVTLTGWIVLIRGVLLLFLLPSGAAARIVDTIQLERFFYAYMAIPLVLGAVLTWLGFAAHVRPGGADELKKAA